MTNSDINLLSVYNTYYAACKKLLDKYLKDFDLQKLFDTNYQRHYISIKDFDIDNLDRLSYTVNEENVIQYINDERAYYDPIFRRDLELTTAETIRTYTRLANI